MRQEAAAKIAAKLAADGIDVKEVVLRDIELPADYARGLEGLLIKEQENERMNIELEVKQKMVRTASLEADAQKARDVKAAEAQAEITVLQAKAQADAQRTALTQTELELADAQATVNRYQKQVLDLQEQQRQAQAKLKGLTSNVSKLGNRQNNTQDSKNQADADYQQAKSDQAAAPTDPTKTTELNRAAAKQTAGRHPYTAAAPNPS